MIRLLGVFLTVQVLYAVLMIDDRARTLNYHSVLAGRLGFYGILTVGVGVLIVSGGIDLSIGSVVGLCAVLFGYLMALKEVRIPPAVAALIVVGVGLVIGLLHGLLVTKLKLQPFLVTLCGLFIYRGLARGLSLSQLGISEEATALKTLLVGGIG